MTAGWDETEVPMDVSSRRLALVLHRHLAEHGLLSFLSLLRAFLLNAIKRNQTEVPAFPRVALACFFLIAGSLRSAALRWPEHGERLQLQSASVFLPITRPLTFHALAGEVQARHKT